MTTSIRGLPQSVKDQQLRGFLNDVRSALLTLKGAYGPGGAAVTGGGTGGGGGGVVVIPGPGGGGEDPGEYVPDLSPPPTPSGVQVDAGMDFVIARTDPPVFTQGHGYARTLIYGAKYGGTGPEPVFSDAVVVHEFVGQVGSFPTDPATQWHLWLKWMTVDGVESVIPSGGTNGHEATTGQDVEKLLEALTGEITASQLHAALGARINLIDGPASMPGSVAARILTETNARTAADSAMATQITQLTASTATNAAAIQTEATARANADAAQSTLLTTVQSRVFSDVGMATRLYWGFTSDNEGWAADEATLGVGPGGVLVYTVTGANAYVALTLPTDQRYTGADATLVRARIRRVSGSAAWEGRCYHQTAGHTWSNSFRGVAAAPTNLSEWNVVEWDMAALSPGGTDYVANQIRGIRLDLDTAAGNVWHIDWIAIGQPSNTPLTAAVQQEITTRAEQTGHLAATYTLRLTAGNLIGGFGISGTSSAEAGPTIDFGIRANRFFIAPPEGVTGVGNLIPFAVQTTQVRTAAGELINPGVYMSAAFIRNLDVVLGRYNKAIIGNALINDLSATKITAGSIAVGEYIQSSNYVANTSGWRIRGDGFAEFSNAVIRGATYTGTIFANAGTIGGIQITSTYIQSSNYAANSAGFRLETDGDAFFNDVRLRGYIAGGDFTSFAWPAAGGSGFYLGPSGLLLGNQNDGQYFRVDAATGRVRAPGLDINNGNAVFSGDLSAAGGTFSGTLTAQAVNAIDSINIRDQAVTFPSHAYTAGSVNGATVQTVVHPSTGAPLLVFAGSVVEVESSNAAAHKLTVTATLTRTRGSTTTTLFDAVPVATFAARAVDNSEGGGQVFVCDYTMAWSLPPIVDTPASGNITYNLTTAVFGIGGAVRRNRNRGIVIVELKK